MADKNKNKKENEEYESDGSVVVYRVDNGRGKGKVSNKDGGSTYFVRKVTDERWETNLPEPLWLADMLQGGYGAKPPCGDFAIDPFDVISMVRGMLPSDDNECVVIYEGDDDEDKDINKFKKGNKMRKYDFFRNGGRYIPYAASGRRVGFYEEPTGAIEGDDDEGIEEDNDEGIEAEIKSFKPASGMPNFYYVSNSNGDIMPIYWHSQGNYAYITDNDTGNRRKLKIKDETTKDKIRNTGMSGLGEEYKANISQYFNLINPNQGYFNSKGEWVINDTFRKALEKDLLYKSLSGHGDNILQMIDQAYNRNDINTAERLTRDYWDNVYPKLIKQYNTIGKSVSVNQSSFNRQGGRYQAGGQMSQQQMMQQIVALVQAAMQGNQEAQEQISQIAQAAENGDPQAQQIYSMIQQVAQKMQGAQSARLGGRFNYIHQLRTGLMPHERVVFNRQGGRLVRSVVDSRRAGGRLQAPRRKYVNYFG